MTHTAVGSVVSTGDNVFADAVLECGAENFDTFEYFAVISVSAVHQAAVLGIIGAEKLAVDDFKLFGGGDTDIFKSDGIIVPCFTQGVKIVVVHNADAVADGEA